MSAPYLAKRLLARLRGQDLDEPPPELDDEAEAHLDLLDARVDNALARDGARVRLEGSTLSLDDAERTLARKEAKRQFPPLRDRVRAALEPFDEHEAEAAEQLVDELELEEPGDPRLEALAGTLKEPAQVALAVLGTELPRGLDPVDESGAFSHELARHLSRAALEAAPTLSRDLLRVRAPRALVGHVVTHAPGPVRALTGTALRGARFARLLEGSAAALTAALLPRGSAAGDRAAARLGTALQLALSGAVVRRAVLDDPRAEDHARLLFARELLATFIAATAAAWPDEARDRLADALGAPVSPAPGLPWPGFGPLCGPRAALGGRALRSAQGARLHRGLRDFYDEAWPLVAPVYERVSASGPALADGALDLFALFELEHEAAPGQALAESFTELV